MTTQEFMDFRAALMREIIEGNLQARTSSRDEWSEVDSTTLLSLYPSSSLEYRIKPKPREVWVSDSGQVRQFDPAESHGWMDLPAWRLYREVIE